MAEDYAVYVVVVEDTERSDNELAGLASSIERVQGRLSEEDAILLATQIAADA